MNYDDDTQLLIKEISVFTMLGTKATELQSYLPTKTKFVFHGN